MINLERTIESQFANSPVLMGLIQNFNDAVDPRANVENFVSQVWNIDTANDWALENVWGPIVGVNRYLQVPTVGPYFGFDQADDTMTGFNQAPFYDPGETLVYALPTEAFRTLIYVKALANISATTIPSLNRLVSNLFAGRGRCYCTDLGNMAMTYTFEFVLLPVELAILEQSGALPHPTGVAVSIVQIPASGTLFGFDGSGLQPFNQGVFFDPKTLGQ